MQLPHGVKVRQAKDVLDVFKCDAKNTPKERKKLVLAKSSSSNGIPFEKRIDPMLDNGLFPGDDNNVLPPLLKKYSSLSDVKRM